MLKKIYTLIFHFTTFKKYTIDYRYDEPRKGMKNVSYTEQARILRIVKHLRRRTFLL